MTICVVDDILIISADEKLKLTETESLVYGQVMGTW